MIENSYMYKDRVLRNQNNKPLHLDLGEHWPPNPWPGIPEITFNISVSNQKRSLHRVKMIFSSIHYDYSYHIDSDVNKDPDAYIIIKDKENWKISLPPVTHFIQDPGRWSYRMQLIDNNGEYLAPDIDNENRLSFITDNEENSTLIEGDINIRSGVQITN